MFKIEEIQKANIDVHTAIADQYLDEPHHRPENKKRIRENLIFLQEQTNGSTLLDIGCGMGFIIDIAKDIFKKIRGVDITPAMLEKVNLQSERCDIKVEIAQAEKLPYDDNTFDVCTAHALLHHLHDIKPVLKEVFRVLRPGGIFYSELDPNWYFWEALQQLDPKLEYHASILREIMAVTEKDKEIAEKLNINVETVQKAEHLQHIHGGFKSDMINNILNDIKFSESHIKYHWFLGEAEIIHKESTKQAANVLRSYLQNILPLSRHLFKYISIYAKK